MGFHTVALASGLILLSFSAAHAQTPLACRSTIAARDSDQVVAVRWISPDDEGDRAHLDAWCNGVGPAVVSATSASDPSAIDGIAIVTWNMHVGAGDLVRLIEDLRAGRLTGGKPMPRFVLLLQEAYRGGRFVPSDWQPAFRTARRVRPDRPRQAPGDIVATAQALGLSLVYVPSMRNGHEGHEDEDRGNAILSSEPLTSALAIELPFERQRRVAVQVTIPLRTPGGDSFALNVTNAHLESMGTTRRFVFFTTLARLEQARFLRRLLPSSGPAVLGGDLNSWLGFGEPAYRALVGTLTRQTDTEKRATFGLLARLDHLIFRLPDSWTLHTKRLPSYGSDHHPLLSVIGSSPTVRRGRRD